MTTSTLHQALAGQTVVILGGSSGIGLETAHQARSADVRVILTGRQRERLDRAARDVDAAGTGILDLGRPAEIERFFTGLAAPIDHVLVSGGGAPYAPLRDIDFDEARRVLDEHLLGALRVARACVGRVRPGGSLIFITGTSTAASSSSRTDRKRAGHGSRKPDQGRDEEHWRASERGETDAEHAIYAADAVLDYPQSSERLVELLGPVDVGDGYDNDLEFHVHSRNSSSSRGGTWSGVGASLGRRERPVDLPGTAPGLEAASTPSTGLLGVRLIPQPRTRT